MGWCGMGLGGVVWDGVGEGWGVWWGGVGLGWGGVGVLGRALAYLSRRYSTQHSADRLPTRVSTMPDEEWYKVRQLELTLQRLLEAAHHHRGQRERQEEHA